MPIWDWNVDKTPSGRKSHYSIPDDRLPCYIFTPTSPHDSSVIHNETSGLFYFCFVVDSVTTAYKTGSVSNLQIKYKPK